MAQLDDLYTALKNADAAGDTASAQKLAAYIKTVGSSKPDLKASDPGEYDPSSQAWQDKYGPLSNMNGVQKFVAGYGAAVPTMLRGIGQHIGHAIDAVAPTLSSRLGLPQQADVDEAKRLDAPLLQSGAGMAGNIAGNIGAAIPAMFVPGANSVVGGAAVGGALGAAQPTATGENLLKNTAMGAGLGGGAVVGGQILGAGARGLQAAIEPFTAAGPQRIAGRTIQRFAQDPSSIANVTNTPTITGAVPTLAEQTGDRGLAQLQDALRATDPQMGNAIAQRAMDNNAARVNALRTMSGQDGARDFAVAERAGTAGPMYDQALSVVPDAAALTPEQSRTMQTLLRSPAVQSAMSDAQAIAANKGTNIGTSNASGSIEGLHNMKMALDDAISTAKAAGQTNKAESIKAAQTQLVGLMESMSPEYANARGVYAQMSQPINQMDIAAHLAQKGFSKGSDLSGNPTIVRNNLLGAMQDEPALIRQATGRPGIGNSLSDVMAPDQMNMLNAIRSEVDRAGAVATAGNGPGSATAQRLASQNILRQTIAPNGGPGNSLMQRAGGAIADNVLANTLVGKATNWLYSGIAEPRIQQELLTAILSPADAQAALTAASQQGITLPNNLLTRLAGQARRVAGVSTANATRQP